jgi:hypothetical protein
VWAGPGVATARCPKSLITPQSLEWLDRYAVWSRWPPADADRLRARDVEAFLILESERMKEEERERTT